MPSELSSSREPERTAPHKLTAPHKFSHRPGEGGCRSRPHITSTVRVAASRAEPLRRRLAASLLLRRMLLRCLLRRLLRRRMLGHRMLSNLSCRGAALLRLLPLRSLEQAGPMES